LPDAPLSSFDISRSTWKETFCNSI
jgi:hypothetical protein